MKYEIKAEQLYRLIEKLKEWLKEAEIFDCTCGSCSRFRSEIASLSSKEEGEGKSPELTDEMIEKWMVNMDISQFDSFWDACLYGAKAVRDGKITGK